MLIDHNTTDDAMMEIYYNYIDYLIERKNAMLNNQILKQMDRTKVHIEVINQTEGKAILDIHIKDKDTGKTLEIIRETIPINKYIKRNIKQIIKKYYLNKKYNEDITIENKSIIDIKY